MRNILRLSLLLILLCGFVACNKDETPVVGQLTVEYKKLEATVVHIYTEVGNKIYSKENPGNFSIDLNPGNYAIFSSTSSSTGDHQYYFQIQAGRTTRVLYHDSSNPIIKYE